jgi:hypothetical protein
MWYFIIIVILLVGSFFGSRALSCQTTNSNEKRKNKQSVDLPFDQNDTIKGMFSKKQIDEKLKHLAETSAPTNLSFGAMCYEMAAIDISVQEYICPVCGEKTIYKKSRDKDQFQYIVGTFDEINDCRREIEKVHGINIKLDETEFCGHCKPKIEKPKLYLLVNIAGQKDTTKISSFYHMDIRILQEFLDNKLVHKTDNDGETPLIDNIGRIKELLGIK